MGVRKKYKFFEHTADVGIRVYGNTVEELFVNAAKGMFEVIAETSGIKPKEKLEISVQADSYDELLRQWLQELLYQFSVTEIVGVEFSIQGVTQNTLKAIMWGDKAPDKMKTEIKAVTYHELEFKQVKDGYEAKVIFDV